ncbi:hypothetical protein JXO59_11795 [candidate division KSB1 bacterium]|nr:hypothetical protein [candidate division KSB1 bacterium]
MKTELLIRWFALSFLLIVIGLASCQSQNNKLSDQRVRDFAMVYSEYLAAIASDTSSAEKSAAKLQQLLDEVQMTREEFNNCKERIEQDPVALKKMLEIVNNKLQTISPPTKKSDRPEPPVQSLRDKPGFR